MGPRMKSCTEFAADGLPFSAAVWMRLQAALLQSRNRLRKNDDTDNLSVSIRSFFRKIKSGFKRFRTIFYGISPPLPAVENLQTVSHFSELVRLPLPSNQSIKKALGLWMQSALPNDMRNFLFLLRNNTLPLTIELMLLMHKFPPCVLFVVLLTGTR